jgi:preprotein translocase subunit SecA
MIDFINKTISGFFGKKSDRDIKSIDPIVAKIHASYAIIEKLSNDGLRQKSNELKAKVAAAVQAEEQRVKDLKAKVETEEVSDVDEKEKIYVEIDLLNKEITKKIQTALDEVLPDAFAIVKETAKRFKENEQLEVTATSFDRELAAKKGNVIIQGEKAFYKNHWIAAGNTVTWDMVHYDVQLIG